MPYNTRMGSEPRQERFEARLSRSQKDLVRRAAEIRGRSLTEFVVSSAVEAAEQVVRSILDSVPVDFRRKG